jgi:uncharacterized protein (TIGR03083 family)
MGKGKEVTTTTTDLWPEVHDERQALLALLDGLMPDQWDSPTLCSRWRIRDVVGHLINTTEIHVPSALFAIARSGFQMNRYIDKDARQRGEAPPAQLLADFRAALPRTTCPPRQSALAMLEDIVIHQIDIRLPLGQPRAVPHERMRLVAGYLDGNGFYPGKKLAQGLRLEATDTDWTTGAGPVVCGPIESLVLTLSGRFIAVKDLHGDGLATLSGRISTAT